MTKLIVSLLLLFSINLIAQDTISKPQLSIISLDKVKVVYRGIDNPITVAVPNAKEYWVSGPGVSKTDEHGKYIIRPGSGNELKIVVKIIFEDNSSVYEEHVYQIKRIPILSSKLNGNKFNKDSIKALKKAINEKDFIIANIRFIVKGFNGMICKISSISGKIVE